jgi:hypothetical protein
MGISEDDNPLRVVAPKMLCDTSLGDEIPEPCPRGHFFWGIFGSAGRGKSSYMISLLTAKGENRVYRKVFHNIYFVLPQNSMASVGSTIYKNHDPDKIYHELSIQNLDAIKGQVEREALEGYNSLLVIDDQTAYLKDRGVDRLLRYLIFNRRHLRLSIFLLAQSYNQLPLSIRKTLSHFTMFAPANKKETQSVFDELIFLPKETAEEVVRYTFRNKHDVLFGNTLDGTMYRNFNRLHITDE